MLLLPDNQRTDAQKRAVLCTEFMGDVPLDVWRETHPLTKEQVEANRREWLKEQRRYD
jgi:hypothetical protein